MIVRFMKNGKVCEISDDDCPILIYPNNRDKPLIVALKGGQALVLGTNDERDIDKMNTEQDPIRLI